MDLSSSIQTYLRDILSDCYHHYELQLEKILKKLDLCCFVADFENPQVSGIIAQKEGSPQFNIYVNKQHSQNRRRFTIAHEIGHYISYQTGSYSQQDLESHKRHEDYSIVFYRDGEPTDKLAEAEANQIAAEMLMPEDKVRSLAAEKLSIENMARLFFVSEAAMAIRLSSIYKESILLT